jgi:hypothetical protein
MEEGIAQKNTNSHLKEDITKHHLTSLIGVSEFSSIKTPIKNAIKSGKFERFTDILRPLNHKYSSRQIVEMLHKEGLTVKSFLVNYCNYHWQYLYFDLLVKSKKQQPMEKIKFLLQSSSQKNSTIDENPEVEFSDSIPTSLQTWIQNLIKNDPFLKNKYIFVKTFEDAPETPNETDSSGKLVTFYDDGSLQLNLDLKTSEKNIKGIILHELTHALRGHPWMKKMLKTTEDLKFTKAMNHHKEREADLLLACLNLENVQLIENFLEWLHKEFPADSANSHPDSATRWSDVCYLHNLLTAEVKIHTENLD